MGLRGWILEEGRDMKVLWLRAGTGWPGLGSQVAAETPGLVTTDTGDQAPAAGIAQSPP